MKSLVEYYGDHTRWFIGTVINLQDPLQLGRVQIRIFGLHNNLAEIPNSALPFAQVVIPVTEGGTSGLGANVGIQPGAQVYGIFLDGPNSQNPIIIGSIPKFETRQDQSEIVNKDPKFLDSSYTDNNYLTGSSNIEKAWNYFRSDVGGALTPEQTAGILGNLAVENGINVYVEDLTPDFNQVGGGPGYGIAQWEGPRKTELQTKFVSDTKTSAKFSGGNYLIDYRSLWAQLTFISHEFETTESNAFVRLKKAKKTNDASDVFLDYYERAAGSLLLKDKFPGDPNREGRREYAAQYLNAFKSSGG